MEFLILFVVAVVFFIYGAIGGWNARERHALKVTKQLVKEVEKNLEEEKKSLIQITIEQHGEMFYVYKKDDKTFMAQGKTKAELEDALTARYPGKKFAASEEELQKAGLLS
jgi:uncharacterized Rmd1/YagE family protein